MEKNKIKKLILLSVFLPIIGLGQKSFDLGFMVGPSINGITGGNASNRGYTVTFVKGINGSYNLNDNMSINSKILLHNKGYTVKSENNGNVTRTRYVDQNISLPITFQYNIGKNKEYIINTGIFAALEYKSSGSYVFNPNIGIILAGGYLYPIGEKVNLNIELSSHYQLYETKRLTSQIFNNTKSISFTSLIGISYSVETK